MCSLFVPLIIFSSAPPLPLFLPLPSLAHLVASSGWDYYVKLVVSSLDYSQGQWSWRLLERCLAAELAALLRPAPGGG